MGEKNPPKRSTGGREEEKIYRRNNDKNQSHNKDKQKYTEKKKINSSVVEKRNKEPETSSVEKKNKESRKVLLHVKAHLRCNKERSLHLYHFHFSFSKNTLLFSLRYLLCPIFAPMLHRLIKIPSSIFLLANGDTSPTRQICFFLFIPSVASM
ncbi:hypothetical protein ES288_D03G138400v1 [Gossypium darwinii]|uniref:Uncharacterized protein n=1 Tax=Gossypium darwinii TaxID=34276 RepID=A0A5D2D5R2_GOSDA|nr:hypothetical protein ES288_D03G138400v1 [Gossypium darwinii]TYG76743.1 hypothetical protein ES288_D03G138400v1 [Gossypium darwinii]TYG76744.1 hypothetical protein ES288_D03G138400v1 [Gossypium darwinii]